MMSHKQVSFLLNHTSYYLLNPKRLLHRFKDFSLHSTALCNNSSPANQSGYLGKAFILIPMKDRLRSKLHNGVLPVKSGRAPPEYLGYRIFKTG
jgi:hypothetical protein